MLREIESSEKGLWWNVFRLRALCNDCDKVDKCIVSSDVENIARDVSRVVTTWHDNVICSPGIKSHFTFDMKVMMTRGATSDRILWQIQSIWQLGQEKLNKSKWVANYLSMITQGLRTFLWGSIQMTENNQTVLFNRCTASIFPLPKSQKEMHISSILAKYQGLHHYGAKKKQIVIYRQTDWRATDKGSLTIKPFSSSRLKTFWSIV